MNQETARRDGKAFHKELHEFCEHWRGELTLAELIAALESEKFFQLQTNFEATLVLANFIKEKNDEPVNKNSIGDRQGQSAIRSR
jgi:hypothetical protein